MGIFMDLTGSRFSRLLVLKKIKLPKKKSKYLCLCDCGEQKIILGTDLKKGKTRSCGCLMREIASKNSVLRRTDIHNLIRGPEHISWMSMMKRCYKKEDPSFSRYGEIGIEVCKEWHEFRNFYKDMGCRPKGTTIDRINPLKGYFKENCRWATPSQQANNKTNNIFFEYNGIKKTATEWGRFIGIDSNSMVQRIKNWPQEYVLTTRKLNKSECSLFKYGKIDLSDKKYRNNVEF